MSEPEIVLARMYRSKRDNQNNDNLPILVWPLEPWGYDGTVTIWERIGQHGGASWGFLSRKTRPASPEEAAAAIRQWRREAPGRGEAECPLVLRKRCPAWHIVRDAHKAQLERLRQAHSPT